MKKFDGMLLACDMDGTLLNSKHEISAKNEKALRYFTEQGGLFSLATGRAPKSIQKYIAKLPFNAPYSLLNGSLILDKDHRVMHCAGMPEETKALIQTVLNQFPELGCEIFINDKIQIRHMSKVSEFHMKTLDLTFSMVNQNELQNTQEWCKINFTGAPDLIAELKKFTEPYLDRFSMANSLPSFWEITKIGIHKGTALKRIASICGIDDDHVYAIGDSNNDETMMRQASIGFAPSNAENSILELAKVKVCSNDENAVAEAIEYLESCR